MDALNRFLQSSENNQNNSFFGDIQSAAGDFVDIFAKDILPNWTKNQLGMQSTDQLAQPVYDLSESPARVNTPNYDNTLWDKEYVDKQYNIDMSTIFIAVAVFVGTILIIKKAR
jgi:hypothetical protein